jgi:integrase
MHGINRLKPLQVERKRKPGRYSDGGGLYLVVSDTGSKSWVFLYMRARKRRELGLGSTKNVPVDAARGLAKRLREALAQGKDPRAERDALLLESEPAPTFKAAAEMYMAAHRPGWRNPEHARQWHSTLETYAFPYIGEKPVTSIGPKDVLRVLTPIWVTKTQTASRVRGRIEAVLDFAAAKQWRSEENPARWRGGLKHTLPAPSKVAQTTHHAALPYAEVPAFIDALNAQQGLAAVALKFAILTAARTREVLEAQWSEFDLQAKAWTVPASRMKGGRQHRVPLSKAAVSLLENLPRQSALLFPGQKRGKSLNEVAMLQLLRRMEMPITVHGFRSSFRDWAAEKTNVERDVIETALAHKVANAVEAAYLRTDHFAKRAPLMESWGRHCTRTKANVIAFERAG